jgi:MFS family permease
MDKPLPDDPTATPPVPLELSGTVPVLPPTPPSVARRGLFAALAATTFRSLRHRDYAIYFAGQAVSFTGSWVQTTALQWSVFSTTRDPIWPPLLMVGAVAPTVLFGTIGGALADRLPKRPLIIACQVLFLLNAAALTLLVWLGLAHPGVALALAVLNGVINAVDLPARLAYVPDLIPRADLVNAIGLNSLLFNLGRAGGPAVAGLMFLLAAGLPGGDTPAEVTRVGASACFALNTLSYAAVIAGFGLMRRAKPTARKKPGRMADGFVFIARNPPLAALLVCTAFLCLFGWPLLTLFPAYTGHVLGHAEKEYSWLVSAMGGGALLAALGNATFGSLARARLFVVIGSVLTAVAVGGMAASTDLPPAALCAAVFGMGMILFLSTGQSVLQLTTPDDARGRVMALWPMTLSGGTVAGNLICGWTARHLPIPQVLGIMAAGTGVTAVAVAVLAWRIHRPVPPGGST